MVLTFENGILDKMSKLSAQIDYINENIFKREILNRSWSKYLAVSSGK